MALVNKLFWSIAAIEALFFVIAFLFTANQTGQNPDGGKGMALFFGIALPFLVLAIICLMFWKTSAPAFHIVLLIAVIVPMVLLAGQWLRGPLMDRDIAVGGYLYKDSKMKKFVAAIARHDEQKVRELAPGVDVNLLANDSSTTPLKFAIERLDSAEPEQVPPSINVIHALLSLGAKPDSALPNACSARHDETVVAILLDAGANPNYKDAQGEPAFFACGLGSSKGLNGLKLLAAKGVDFNALDAEGMGALMHAVTFSNWEMLLFFLDQGVKDTPTPNGRTAAAAVTQAIADDKQNSRETSPTLKLVDSKLNH